MLHHFAFSGSQSVAPPAQLSQDGLFLAGSAIALDGLLDRIQQILVPKWFGEKLDRPGLHRPYRHGDVAMTGDEDDRDGNIGLYQLALQVQAAQPRKSYVKHKASRRVGSFAAQKLVCRRECLNRKSDGSDKAVERLPDGGIIVHNVND